MSLQDPNDSYHQALLQAVSSFKIFDEHGAINAILPHAEVEDKALLLRLLHFDPMRRLSARVREAEMHDARVTLLAGLLAE